MDEGRGVAPTQRGGGFPSTPQQAWADAARVRRQSQALREQLGRLAERVAEVEEQSAAIHQAMAERGGPLADATTRAARARWFAAAERAVAQAYRRGVVPPEVAWATPSPVDPALGAAQRPASTRSCSCCS